MSETTKNRLYLMITITNRVMGATHFLDFYRAFGAPVVFTALGRGTASNDVLSYLGLEATEKSVMFSVVTPAVKEVLMRELVDTMRIDRPGSGIAVCLHLSSVGGRTALNYLISGKSDAQPDMTVKEEEQMNENAYQLIVAITNTGYTDAVMEAASAAGARGGTVIHARATDAGNTNKFFGMAISEEREMIFLVTSADKRAAIMQSIMEKAGAHTEAQTVTFSVPLDDEVADSERVRFVFIDTTPLIGKYRAEQAKYPDVQLVDPDTEVRWIDSVLCASNEKWKIVVGHHPMYTYDGKDDCEQEDMRARLEEIFRRNSVDAYFCGHIHTFQHIRTGQDSIDYVVNTSASKQRAPQRGPLTQYAGENSGFGLLSFDEGTMHYTLVNSRGEREYEIERRK